MLFVSLGKARTGNQKDRIARRIQWTYPPGVKLVAEYWLQCDDPSVVVVTETDDVASILAATSAWDDFFSWTVVPAVTFEQGLEIARKMA